MKKIECVCTQIEIISTLKLSRQNQIQYWPLIRNTNLLQKVRIVPYQYPLFLISPHSILFFKFSRYTEEIYHCTIFFSIFSFILKYFYFQSRVEVDEGLKKSVPGYARLHRNVTNFSVTAFKKTVQFIKFVTVTVGPLFF